MHFFDLIFIVLAGLFALKGYLKGFTRELFSLASLALALVVSVFFHGYCAVLLRLIFVKGFLLTFPIPEIISFLILFIIVFFTGKFAGSIVRDIIESLGLRSVDKFLGIFFGGAKALAIIFLILFLATIQPVFALQGFLNQSFFGGIFLQFLPHAPEMPAPELTPEPIQVIAGIIRRIYHV